MLKVMLTKNVWQSTGLYNGSLGTIMALLFADDVQQPALPTCALVEFDDYIGPSIVPGRRIVPIVPETAVFDPRSGKTDSRIQLLLILGWAITIHKSQDLTLGKVIMDVGDREMMIGSTFVGCLRVRSPRNLVFLNSFPFQRVQRLNDARRMRIVAEEMQRLAV
jgi:ATP-dependent exoDNAse (exonuclease V) alpha subunit